MRCHLHLNSKLQYTKYIRCFENEIKEGYDDLLSKQKFMMCFENELVLPMKKVETSHKNCEWRGYGKGGVPLCSYGAVAERVELPQYEGKVRCSRNQKGETFYCLPSQYDICSICRVHSKVFERIDGGPQRLEESFEQILF